MAIVETATSASTHAASFVERMTVRNFKGIEHLELELKPGLSLLVGRNNAGKSRLLRALHIAVGDVSVERDDLTVGSDEPAEIDVVIAPLPVVAKTATDTSIGLGSQTGVTDELFDQALLQVLSESVALVSDSPVRQRFGWRTKITSTSQGTGASKQAHVMRYSVEDKSWQPTDRFLERRTRSLMHAELVDTRRDLDIELRQRGTAIRRILNDLRVEEPDREELEQRLVELGDDILQQSGTLSNLRDSLDSLDSYMDAVGAARVDPVPQTLEELARTVGVSFGGGTDHLASRLHGSGVRSLASLLVQDIFYRETLGADGGDIRPHPVTLIEEPESHLHPHALIEVAALLESGGRQVVATTHSPLLATSVTPESIVLVRRALDVTHTTVDFGPTYGESDNVVRTRRPAFYASEMEKLKRLVERPFGDLLFARAIVVGDGATERAFLPVALREALGPLAHGISVVDSEGMNRKLVEAMIMFARHVDVPLVVFADNDSAGGKEINALQEQGVLDEAREVVWVGTDQSRPSSSNDKRPSFAIERMVIDASPAACNAACEALGRPAEKTIDLLPQMKKLKGSIGTVLAKEFVSQHPFSEKSATWPSSLLRLVDLLRERLNDAPDLGDDIE